MTAAEWAAMTGVPAEVIAARPSRSAPAISPDGTTLAWSAADGDLVRLWTGRAGQDGQPVGRARSDTVKQLQWAPDGRHLLMLRDVAGDENHHVISVDTLTGTERDLTPYAGVRAGIVDTDAARPGAVVVTLNDADPARHDLYAVDLATGDRTLLAESDRILPTSWLVAPDLTVLAGIQAQGDGSTDLVRNVDGGWAAVLPLELADTLVGERANTLVRGPAGTVYLTNGYGAETVRLLRVDLATGRYDVVAEHPTYDVETFVVDPATRAVQAVAYSGSRLEWVAYDPTAGAALQAVGAHGGRDVRVLDQDATGARYVVEVSAPHAPSRYHVLDLRTGTSTYLYAARPELDAVELAEMEPFEFDSRDGLRVHGYLSYPPGAGRTALPAVLLVHGGPWKRDHWTHEGIVQFLATRGYLVVQVNFRGSTGYGRTFREASRGEWGRAMHTDLLDALDHLVEDGIVDPERVAIAGGSYGGYAALVGATFTPDRFRCAISVMGPSNLITLVRSFPAYWAQGVSALFRRDVGDPDVDAELLWERSPLSRVDAATRPVMLVHGANDPRVNQAESDQIADALRARGVPVTYLRFDDEGHAVTKPANIVRLLTEMEEFLADHLTSD
ncbi:MAG: hypothetical protein QOE45_3003 [Frankiaceae bacterium]|jgi:dipeptidyl aminopeptidase/acylaminoacyl peptidase|nr:hypothetical protein [Frankiaceae bacterium]